MKLAQISIWSIRALEALTLLALLGSTEIQSNAFVVTVGIGAMTFFLHQRRLKTGPSNLIPTRYVLLLTITAMGTALAGALVARMPALIASSYLALALLTLTWLLAPSRANRTLRLSLSFVCLILAASLTPELYLAAIITAFVVLGAVLLICHYLESEFEKHASHLLNRNLPGRIIGQAAGLSLIVFVLSLVIFPILPRPKPSSYGGLRENETGYTEKIDLTGGIGFGAGSNQTPVIRFYLPDVGEAELQLLFPKLLVRARVLSQFDGHTWYGRPMTSTPILNLPKSPNTKLIQAIREPIKSQLLPIPYGSQLIHVGYDELGGIKLSSQGEWYVPEGAKKRLSYEILLNTPEANKKQEPTVSDTRFPDMPEKQKKKWKNLTQQLFQPNQSIFQKIRSLESFFKDKRFKAKLLEARQDTQASAVQNIETFLFVDREGHCELFSSAAALLFRSANIPARVISGFRIASSPTAQTLTIRQEDAHAWVEVWDEKNGWIPLDPTPTYRRNTIFQMKWLRSMRDFVGAYWYRYVVGFEEEGSDETSQKKLASVSRSATLDWLKSGDGMKTMIGVVLFVLVLASVILSFVKRRNRKPTVGLLSKLDNRELSRLWHKAHKKGVLEQPQWKAVYEELRFGPIVPNDPRWKEQISALRSLLTQ